VRILLIHGPNLNMLGQRQPEIYGRVSMKKINELCRQKAEELGCELVIMQSNHEGFIIDFLQENFGNCDGIIINPGALTHYGLALRDALESMRVPIVEVHLSNVYAREEWRHKSVIAPIALGQIIGFGYRGYTAALQLLYDHLLDR